MAGQGKFSAAQIQCLEPVSVLKLQHFSFQSHDRPLFEPVISTEVAIFSEDRSQDKVFRI